MKLKISSPEKLIFEWEIKQVSLPTANGEITILPNHAPLVTSLKPWLIRVLPQKAPEGEFIFTDQYINISVSKGMAFVDGKMIRVVTATATTAPHESTKTLEQMRMKLESAIKDMKQKWSLEEVEKSLIKLEKLNADIELSKMVKRI